MKQSNGLIFLRVPWGNKSLIFIAGVLAITTVLAYRAALPVRAAGPWYVTPGGNDGNSCLSPASPCATINGAIGKASSDDTIYVTTGTYTNSSGNEVVLIDKNITLSGGWDLPFVAQSELSIIDGMGVWRGIVINFDTIVTLERFVVQHGFGLYGGGILNEGTLNLIQSEISENNTNGGGGGIYTGGTLNVINSAINNNNSGGGIYAFSGTSTIINSTISGNHGGGIFVNAGVNIFLSNSTISRNLAVQGGGLSIWPDGNVSLHNTILSGNTASSFGPDCNGGIHSSGYNILGDTSGCSFMPSPSIGDLLNTNPYLVSLIGTPGYHPLFPISPAIDAGDPAGCTDNLGNPLDTDQRGVARVGRCDIGSYEYDPANDPLQYIALPLVLR